MTRLIHSTIPTLASLDLHETVAFYTAKLGFVLQAQMHNYAILEREGCEIHFHACDDPVVAANTACYVRSPDTQRLFEEFTRRGLHINPPEIRPWAMKELYVIDPHGNLLKFGEDA